MLHELLLALSGDIGGIFVQKHKEGLKVGFGEIIIQIFENDAIRNKKRQNV